MASTGGHFLVVNGGSLTSSGSLDLRVPIFGSWRVGKPPSPTSLAGRSPIAKVNANFDGNGAICGNLLVGGLLI